MKATKKKSSRRKATKTTSSNGMIDFNYHDRLYQIDPARRKVYHRWVEVETSKTCLIMGAYTSSQVHAE